MLHIAEAVSETESSIEIGESVHVPHVRADPVDVQLAEGRRLPRLDDELIGQINSRHATSTLREFDRVPPIPARHVENTCASGKVENPGDEIRLRLCLLFSDGVAP